ncbi:MAGUK p55 subfamily member 7 isoform X1 [Lates japonicus]|uniref:MAGUK p55 subfamily member 7 isoform X1 n=1 Tax=Lates japonicus TaxID=270547 RepID=A0AAD3R4M6_LATJO|nr:MAGUK p55 subfamily member 7 isoform X1 [Lates japonicus]
MRVVQLVWPNKSNGIQDQPGKKQVSPPFSGLYELLAALPSQLQPHVSCPEDNAFLQDMFGERSLQSLVKLSEELEGKSANGDVKELLKLLAKPHVKSLLTVHDTVARKSYDPELPPLPEDIDDDEDSVKIIRLVKNKEPLALPTFDLCRTCPGPGRLYFHFVVFTLTTILAPGRRTPLTTPWGKQNTPKPFLGSCLLHVLRSC